MPMLIWLVNSFSIWFAFHVLLLPKKPDVLRGHGGVNVSKRKPKWLVSYDRPLIIVPRFLFTNNLLSIYVCVPSTLTSKNVVFFPWKHIVDMEAIFLIILTYHKCNSKPKWKYKSSIVLYKDYYGFCLYFFIIFCQQERGNIISLDVS